MSHLWISEISFSIASPGAFDHPRFPNRRSGIDQAPPFQKAISP